MNPLTIAPLAIGTAGIAAYAASKLSGATFGQILSLGEKPVDTDAVAAAESDSSALDSLFAASGQLSGTSVDELSASTDQLVGEIEAAIRQLLDDQGINPGAEFQLTINQQGEVAVDGAGASNDKLAELINADDALANKIRQAAANRSLLAAAAEHQDFSAAFNQDQQHSIDAYQSLFEQKEQGSPLFTFRADEGLSLDLA
ncbi:hypothetical protein [Blastopirellula marina]|uniref:Uncharacterized protein n=1 Tax=Blastopirellula marina TaxID=124 RepID=A0A2S8GKT3_9BACT|nr:hypothetical protein [Blastopirellula marina]PQO45000.1 hypothetical protein C5Y93_15815 [Blastopirellula marina]